MSISISLVPLAIAVAITVNETIIKNIKENKEKYLKDKKLPLLQTKYNNIKLLYKTLTDHGFKVNNESDNCLFCYTPKGTLKFLRGVDNEAFSVEILDVENIDELICDLELLENEYNENVQSFTYNKLISSLEENNMSVESEEILEDNSIVITINV